MTVGNSSVKTIADTGLNESIRYAENQQVLESFGLNAGQFVQPQVELLNVSSQPSVIEREANFYVPPANPLASFYPPEGFNAQRRGLFSSSIAPTIDRVLSGTMQQLASAEVPSGAQETQKQKLTESFDTLGTLNKLLLSVRNNIGRLRQG